MQLPGGALIPEAALEWRATPSSGPGGQHANRSSTRIELRLSIAAIENLSEAADRRLRLRLASRIDAEGRITVQSQDERSQKRNRDLALERLRNLLVEALTPPKPRKATKPTLGSKRRRLESKRARSDLKRQRRGPLD